MNCKIYSRHITVLILVVFSGCSNPKSQQDSMNEISKTKQILANENTTEEKNKRGSSKTDTNKPDPESLNSLRDMNPVEVAKYHFAAAINGEKDKFFDTCILPRNKAVRDKFVKHDFKNITAFYDRYEIEVVEGKTVGNLSVVGKCDLDSSGNLRDIDAILLRKTDQIWKVIKAPNFLLAKHELTEKDDLSSHSKILEWLKTNATILKERLKRRRE